MSLMGTKLENGKKKPQMPLFEKVKKNHAVRYGNSKFVELLSIASLHRLQQRFVSMYN